jgi:uncharacterized membrane protein
MTALILGLVLFLGMHSLGFGSGGLRAAGAARLGERPWKAVFAIASVVGFVLILWGYRAARADPVVPWATPVWTRHLAALLTVPAFVLLVAAYVPGNAIRARLGHPMVLGVKTWALSHLLANNTLADLLLFGGFLAWSVVAFRSLRRRDAARGVVRAAGTLSRTLLAVVGGLAAWALFAFWIHGAWIGVRPFG